MVALPLEDLPLPVTTVITEGGLTQIQTDLTCQTLGMKPLGVTETEEEAAEEVAEVEEEAEDASSGISLWNGHSSSMKPSVPRS